MVVATSSSRWPTTGRTVPTWRPAWPRPRPSGASSSSIDADPSGRLSWLLGASGLPGLHDPLGYRERLTDRIVPGSIPNTRILPAGTNPGATNPSPEEARELLESVAGPGDVVIVDAGTLPGSSTAMVWAGVVGRPCWRSAAGRPAARWSARRSPCSTWSMPASSAAS